MNRSPPRLALAIGLLIYGLVACGWLNAARAADPLFSPHPIPDRTAPEQTAPDQTAPDQTAQATGSPPIYVPPRRGGPSDVAPAATRGGVVRHKVKLLGPDHTGLTTVAQPTLYMYVGETTRLQLLLTRVGDTAAPPVASGRLEVQGAPAIVPLQFAALGANLDIGVEYRLTVLSLDRAGSIRANDSVLLMRVAAPPELAAATASGPLPVQARILAGAGVWYDALHALGQAAAGTPADPAARADRAALLEQAGMPEIASFDRRAAPRG